MSDSNIILNLEKCEFSKTTVKVLGNIVSSQGVSHNAGKIEAIVNLPVPKNVSEVRSFVGMINQFSKFTDHLADKAKQLRDLPSKNNTWSWGYAQDKAYKEIKKCRFHLLFWPCMTVTGEQRCLVIPQLMGEAELSYNNQMMNHGSPSYTFQEHSRM